jgi:hypothetical protein
MLAASTLVFHRWMASGEASEGLQEASVLSFVVLQSRTATRVRA